MRDFQAGVGLSRSWGPKKAGEEVAVTALEKLDKDPKFFLLYSTIHFDKEKNGMQKFVEAAYDQLPKGTPLIGGTVAGFINPYGCYTRGATGMAVSYSNMDVTVGIGHNTKRNPKKAAMECAEMINTGLDKSRFENTFIIDLISGSLILQIPGVGRKRILGEVLSFAAELSYDFSLNVLQKGSGREDEVLREFIKETRSKPTLSGSCMDDNNLVNNYQFFGRNVIENSIIALAIKTDMEVSITKDPGTTKTDTYFHATKFSKDKRIIKEINNKPALQGFLDVMGWPIEYITERMYRKTWHYPFMFTDKDGREVQEVLGLVLGSSVLFSYMTESPKLQLLSASGKSMIGGVTYAIQKQKYKNPSVGIIINCAICLEALGHKVFTVKEELDKFFRDTPYLLVYVAGEGVNTPQNGLSYGNLTFNLATLNQK